MTPRQLQILGLAAAGLQMDEIARRVFVTEWSVKNDLVRARRHLRARNTAHAVALAIGRGILPGRVPPGPRRPLKFRVTGTGWPA